MLAVLAMLRVLKLVHMSQQGLQQAGCVRAKDKCKKVGTFKQKERFLLSVEAKETVNGRTYFRPGLAAAETPRCGSLRHHHHHPINIISNGSAG